MRWSPETEVRVSLRFTGAHTFAPTGELILLLLIKTLKCRGTAVLLIQGCFLLTHPYLCAALPN